MSSNNERLQTAQWVFERQLAWIAAADAKVAVVVTLDLAMLAAICALVGAERWSIWASPDNKWAIRATVAAMAPLVASLVLAAWALFPRKKGPPTSLLFFLKVSKQPLADYVVQFRDVADDDLLADWSAQIHRNAEIAADKMWCVKWSMAAAFLAIPFWFCAVLALLNKTT
ncbi:Pycsar system effector family protein [Mitsuaria sp. 7]|uniref:Pycsar system effector family protein n=1 Tax=Mitsuaria sp. 7 TaxID=1658665 RepID=UPI0007DDBC5E|nr:Pycsar system effector family protein [Mitsuaria sp. 7]ANH69641.1 hypothetical protein ABE85_22380 [Mitsuaria sp. 7]